MKHLAEVLLILGILFLAGIVSIEGYQLFERTGKVVGLIVCGLSALSGLAIAAIRIRVLLRELVDLEVSRINKIK